MNIAALTKFLPKTLLKINSPVNGEISVVEQFNHRKIMIGGLTQSGPMAEEVWREGVKVLSSKYYVLSTKKILILGLGGGSLVKLLNHSFPQAKITGVEIDPIMVELGKKYLDLGGAENLEIKTTDAADYLLSAIRHKLFYNLIFVDMYQGDKVPEFSGDESFLQNLNNILSENGMVIFNRLYYKNHISEANKFLDKLKKIFDDLDCQKVLTNLIVFARR